MLLFLLAILASCTTINSLNRGWHTYPQIEAKGYKTKPFTGKVFLYPTSDSTRNNIVKR